MKTFVIAHKNKPLSVRVTSYADAETEIVKFVQRLTDYKSNKELIPTLDVPNGRNYRIKVTFTDNREEDLSFNVVWIEDGQLAK
jgi:hypothetical protein